MPTSSRMRPIALLAATSAAFALLLVSIWTARNVAAAQPDSVVNFARLVKIVACFAVAGAFRSYLPPVRPLFVTGAVLLVVYGLLYILALGAVPADAPEHLPLLYLAGLFSGVGEACLILVAAHLVATFPPRLSTVAIAGVFLLNEVLYLVLSYAGAAVLVWVRLGMEFGAAGLLGACLAYAVRRDPAPDVHPVQYGVDGPRDGSEHVLRFLGGSREWVLLLVGTTLFPFVFGVVSQVVGAARHLPGLYDPATEVAAIGLLCLLVGFGLWRGTRLTYDGVLACTVPLFATGCLLLPLLWESNPTLAGLLVKGGYTVYQVMFWMLLVRKAYEDPRHTYLYFGAFYGVFELATLLAREGVYLLGLPGEPTQEVLWVVGSVSLWLISLYSLAFFLLSKWWERAAEGAAAEPDRSADGSLQARVEAFCATYALSAREAEVLVESLHGYSMEAVGRRLCISKDTVKTHLQRIYRKAGVSGKQALVEVIDAF